MSEQLLAPETGEPLSSTLAAAVLAFQAEAPTLYKGETAKVKTKQGGEYTYRYIGLDTIMETIQPLLTKHQLVWWTFPSITDGKPTLAYALSHPASGDIAEGTLPLLLKDDKDPQAFGSALTYARRYALCCVLNLVADEDDDAQRARTTNPPAQQATQHKDDQRPAAPRIPQDRAQEILQQALRTPVSGSPGTTMASLGLDDAPGTPPVFHPVFKAALGVQGVARIGELNVDAAETVEAFLRAEQEGQG